MAVRVIVTVTTPSVAAADAAIADRVELCRRTEAEEEGCLQYEVFRSALRPERFVLCELWSSREIYDKHWNLQQERERAAGPKPPPAPAQPGEKPRTSTVEFYEQRIYKNVDGVWMAADEALRSTTVRWV
jgi:quinol monooxygenase YgiN